MTPEQKRREYLRGLNAAKKAVLRRLPLKRASSINSLTAMAGMDSAEVYQCAAEEVQQEMVSRLNAAIARSQPAPPSASPSTAEKGE